MKQIVRSSCECPDCEPRLAEEALRVFWRTPEGRDNIRRTREWVTERVEEPKPSRWAT